MRRTSLMLAVIFGAPLSSTSVQAQILDYAALGDTFGEPITTSVIGKPQRASEAPASITIITAEQIARSPARNVPDLLKAQAGVDVNRWTAGQSDVAVRGGVQTYNARLLVLVDGRQVYLDHYGMTNWNLLGIQMDEIQQIELVRGPASALFGFNAASGVVNIVTKNVADVAALNVRGEVGTHGYSRIAATMDLPVTSGANLRVSGGRQEENERYIPAALYQPPFTRDIYSEQLSGTLAIQPGSATSIELNAGANGNRQLEFLPSQILTEQRFRNQTAGILVNHDTPWGSITARTYTNWLRSDYGITTPVTDPYRAVADVQTRNRIVVGMASTLVRLGGSGTLRLGAEYRNNQLTSGRLYSDRVGYQVASASGMLDVQPTDRMTVTGALRLDRLKLEQGGIPVVPQIDPVSAYGRVLMPVSFNAAMTLQVGEAGRLRVNGGRGLQLPSLTSLGLHVDIPAPDVPVSVYLVGDPRLAPVNVWSSEVSYSHAFPSGVRVDATAFYTRTDNLIASPGGSVDVTIAYTPAPVAVTRFANVGAFTSYGMEVTASGHLTGQLGWSANYSLTRINEDIPANREAIYYAIFPKAATPRHRANLSLDYASDGWAASAIAHLMTSTRQSSFLPNTNLISVHVPTSVGVDAKVTRTLNPRLSLYAAAENTTDAKGVYGSPLPADRRIRLGLLTKI